MDILERLQRRVTEAGDLARLHPRPWLSHLWSLPRVQDGLCELTAAAPVDAHLLRDVCLATRLKPTGQPRDFAFVSIEVELAMMAQANELVRELDGPARRRISFATPVSFGAKPYWSPQSFAHQRLPGGAYFDYRHAQEAVQKGAPFVATTDVRRYFPSLGWSAIVNGTAYACRWERQDVKQAISLIGKIRMALQGRHPGLPVGLDLSSVLGNAILAQVDDLLLDSAHDGLVARWVDDITVGVRTHSEGQELLAAIAAGPLRRLNIDLHPAKTEVVPAAHWTPATASMVSVSDLASTLGLVSARPEDLMADIRGPMSRAPARDIMQALAELALDQEREAQVLADHAAKLALGMPNLGRRLRELVGEPLPTQITDRFLASCRMTPPNSAWEGEVAELILHLDQWGAEVGSDGKRHLRALVADRNRSERARVTAAWVLARRTGDHDDAMLERLNEMSVPAARGAVGAAHVAGLKLTNFHYRQSSLVAG